MSMSAQRIVADMGRDLSNYLHARLGPRAATAVVILSRGEVKTDKTPFLFAGPGLSALAHRGKFLGGSQQLGFAVGRVYPFVKANLAVHIPQI